MVAHRGSRLLRLTAIARAAPCLALLVAALPLLESAARAEAPEPSYRKVPTSRGEFDLVVYAPAEPAKPQTSETPKPASERLKPQTPEPAKSQAPESAKPQAPRPVVLLVSGEGGWKSFDILLSGYLTDDGFWVGGVDAKAYFSEPQDDRGLLAGDMRGYALALNAAAGRPPDAPLILVGYSFGADLAPWIAGAPGWGGRIHGQLLIGPDKTGSLQYRITEMLGITYKDHSFSVAEALKSSAGLPTVFIHGEKDGWDKSVELIEMTAEPRKMFSVPGATHHFGGHLDELRAALKDGMRFILDNAAGSPPAGLRSR